MSNNGRECGDDLKKSDNRLHLNWKWKPYDPYASEDEIREWVHNSCSLANFRGWFLEVVRWGIGRYQADVYYYYTHITSKDGYKKRITAQIGAENLLRNWIQDQHRILSNRMKTF